MTPRQSRIQARAATDRALTALDVRVLLVLGRHVDGEGRCVRSQARIASELDCTVRSVRRALRRLAAEGYVRSEARANRHGRTISSAYVLLLAGADSTVRADSRVRVTRTPGVTPVSLNGPSEDDSLSGARVPDQIGRGPLKARRAGRQGPARGGERREPRQGRENGQREMFPARAVAAGEPLAAPRATRIAEDWSPSETDIAAAVRIGVPSAAIAAEAEKFRDRFLRSHGARALSADWSADWRTWCRRYVEHAGQAGEREGRPHGKGPVDGTGRGGRPRARVEDWQAGVAAYFRGGGPDPVS